MMMMQQHVRAPGNLQRAARGRAAPASPLAPALRSVLVRFKEDDKTEAEFKKAADKMRSAKDQVGDAAQSAAQGVKEQARETLADVGNSVKDTAQGLQTEAPTLFRRGYFSTTTPFFVPIFSRRREVWVGRIAMLGFFATCVWEALSPGHLGPLAQASSWTGLEVADVTRILTATIAFNALALLPFSPTFSAENMQDVDRRPSGPGLVKPYIFGNRVPDNLAISGWGFTKRNEVFNGRIAMLAFAWTVLGELNTGLGPIAQLFRNLGKPLSEDMYGEAGSWFSIASFTIIALTSVFGSRLQTTTEAEIY